MGVFACSPCAEPTCIPMGWEAFLYSFRNLVCCSSVVLLNAELTGYHSWIWDPSLRLVAIKFAVLSVRTASSKKINGNLGLLLEWTRGRKQGKCPLALLGSKEDHSQHLDVC